MYLASTLVKSFQTTDKQVIGLSPQVKHPFSRFFNFKTALLLTILQSKVKSSEARDMIKRA